MTLLCLSARLGIQQELRLLPKCLKKEMNIIVRLQLPLYALAAQEALGEEVASGFYWHIGSAKPSSLKLEKYEGGVVGAIEAAVDYALAIGTAVRAGQFAPTPSDDGCPTFCPAATFCGRYKPRAW